ncbi:DUF1801 domain-containing protein [Schleiferilactobacillus shenzhenensis]|uniref:YdhG-like domain-containing protein n=1 Tax=Schleiferilactobacillus shenzhenensis LY-73 TaxID=1231336 RepID=U4TU16_9LACO|nr:DUF1801 domain-containing protein [Schleiferilactobacillus shenzhenensis]ERL64932.1 hypothetical protein L248_0536 [Schleiferilactobacillus shenzhenensis LY-73]
MPQKPEVKDVPDYLDHASVDARPLLTALDQFIREEWPGAARTIKYGQPFYELEGQRLSIAAYQKHVSVSSNQPLPQALATAFTNGGYEVGEKRVNIAFHQDIPEELLHQWCQHILENATA